MEIRQLFFKNNNCYKADKWIKVKGILIHSTGAPNPNLRRYIGPDDGVVGPNTSNNHWNVPNLPVCVHGFIGKDKNGKVRVYQTLPWNMRGWHGASGKNGSVNNTHTSFEICEDGLKDPVYFNAVYNKAVELCVFLCGKFNLTENNILCHSEAHALGLASNHADVMHWFPRFNKNMDIFRNDVGLKLAQKKGEFNLMDYNLKPICKGKFKNTSTLECCSAPSNSARTGIILRERHMPVNIYAKAIDAQGNEWYLVNINPKLIQWVAASGIQLIL